MSEVGRLSIAQKLKLLPNGSDTLELEISDDEYLEDGNYRAFASCRQPNQRAEMLDLVTKNGDHESFSYSHLYRTRYIAENGIVLQFSDHLVRIQGRALRDGYRRILGRQVIQVTEADAPTARAAGDKEPIVTGIKIDKYHPELPDA